MTDSSVDFHTHIFPDQVADRALAFISHTYHAQPAGPGTAAGLVEALQEAGVQRAVVLPVATRPQQVRSINRWISSLDRTQFEPFGALHPECDDLAGEIAFLHDQGLRGIKLQPHFQGFELASAAVWRMMESLEGLVILLHAGQEMSPLPQVPTTPQRLRELHDRFPQHRLVLAHLGGFQMWEAAREHLVGREVYLDISFTFGHLPDEQIAQIIAAHGPHRILFGSDYPWARPAQVRAGLARLALDAADERLILGGNAQCLLAPCA